MLAGTHMLGGAVAAVVVARLTGLSPAEAAVAGALGALLPDLDSRGSKGARLLGPAVALGAAACTMADGWTLAELKLVAVLLVAGAIAPPLLARALGHRGALHSGALHLVAGGAAVAAALASGLPRWTAAFAMFATVGSVVGGLLLDACTIRGIPLFWPFCKEMVHLVPERWRVRTGRRRELYVRGFLAALLVAVLIQPVRDATARWRPAPHRMRPSSSTSAARTPLVASSMAPPLLRLRQPARQLRSGPRAVTQLVLGSSAEAAPRPCRRHPAPGVTGLAAGRGAAC